MELRSQRSHSGTGGGQGQEGGREVDEIPAGLVSPDIQAGQQGEDGSGAAPGVTEVRQLRGQGKEVRPLTPHSHQGLPPRDITPQKVPQGPGGVAVTV